MTRTRLAPSLLVAVVVALALPSIAHAQELKEEKQAKIPQRHEFGVDFALVFAHRYNQSNLAARYVFTPEALDRRDDVVPLLRRHVRRPDELHVVAYHFGSQIDTMTGAFAGGSLHLFDKRLYLAADGGITFTNVGDYDGHEDGYYTAPVRGEIGGYPLELLGVGAYWEARPVIDHTLPAADSGFAEVHRSGLDQEIGGVINFSLPTDRLLIRLLGGYRITDWTFTGFHPGPMTIRGAHVHAFVSYQAQVELSYYLQADVRYETWHNDRPLDDDPLTPFVDGVHRTVPFVDVEAGLIYWFEGRLGFGVALGGGWVGHPPTYQDPRVGGGSGRLAATFTTRF